VSQGLAHDSPFRPRPGGPSDPVAAWCRRFNPVPAHQFFQLVARHGILRRMLDCDQSVTISGALWLIRAHVKSVLDGHLVPA